LRSIGRAAKARIPPNKRSRSFGYAVAASWPIHPNSHWNARPQRRLASPSLSSWRSPRRGRWPAELLRPTTATEPDHEPLRPRRTGRRLDVRRRTLRVRDDRSRGSGSAGSPVASSSRNVRGRGPGHRQSRFRSRRVRLERQLRTTAVFPRDGGHGWGTPRSVWNRRSRRGAQSAARLRDRHVHFVYADRGRIPPCFRSS
jgi:hypothetical protein